MTRGVPRSTQTKSPADTTPLKRGEHALQERERKRIEEARRLIEEQLGMLMETCRAPWLAVTRIVKPVL